MLIFFLVIYIKNFYEVELEVFGFVLVQASQGDLPVGLYMWAHVLLPMLNNKSNYNPQARDLILQLVERYGVVKRSPTHTSMFCSTYFTCLF